MKVLAWALAGLCLSALGCPAEPGRRPLDRGLGALQLTSVEPGVVLPGTTLVMTGDAFVDTNFGVSYLQLSGTLDRENLDVRLPATFVDQDQMRVELTPERFARLGDGDGDFVGSAQAVVETTDGVLHGSPPLALNLALRTELQPRLEPIESDHDIYVNDPIALTGEGLLLDPGEGISFAVLEGCFRPEEGGECVAVGPAQVPIEPDEPFNRTQGTFVFSPKIAGIKPGSFVGQVLVRNETASGRALESEAMPISYQLIPTEVFRTSTSDGQGASLGQFIDIEGGGFVEGDDQGFTLLRVQGTYTPAGESTGVPVSLEVLPKFESGRKVRYVLNEEDQLGKAIDLRTDTGTFVGTLAAEVQYGSQSVTGPTTAFNFSILPLKQVVWIEFLPSYALSMRTRFGLRAVDFMIRERIFEVLRRDYESINMDFRTEAPTDFKDYSLVQIAGPDPNGRGLLGYDNTPGKDTRNKRLYDRLGGINAITQADGFDGFGGVFIDSLFAFSKHPAVGKGSKLASPLFDQIFDPFRPDTGRPLDASDTAQGPIEVLTSGESCPAVDRRAQAACAVWAMGSLIGTTLAHEIGHSLGLADPYGSEPHDFGDGENRLMDAGAARPLEERAELMGQGPGRFCTDEYDYLRLIMPTTGPETTVERPSC